MFHKDSFKLKMGCNPIFNLNNLNIISKKDDNDQV